MAGDKRFSQVKKMLEERGWALIRAHGSHLVFRKPGIGSLSIPVHKGKVKPVFMCAQSKNSKIDRPFDPALWEKARRIAAEYKLVMAFEDGEWIGHGLELPLVFGDGPNPTECVADTREALAGAVAQMLEEDQAPPRPAREGLRSYQVNVKLTAEEKAILETRAKQRGFRGLSDFVRASALAFGDSRKT